MNLCNLTDREQEIYDIYVEELEEFTDGLVNWNEGSEAYQYALLHTRVLSRVLPGNDENKDTDTNTADTEDD